MTAEFESTKPKTGMEVFRPPAELNFSIGNVAENWRIWCQKLRNFLIATEKNDKPDSTKIAILLNLLGDEGVSIFNTFRFEEGKSADKFEDVLERFNEYCIPRKNVVFERHKFFSCSQVEGQAIDSYLTLLRTLAASCELLTRKSL